MEYDPNLPSPIDALPAELQLRIFEYALGNESPTVREENVEVARRNARPLTPQQERAYKIFGSYRGFTVVGKTHLAFTSPGTRGAYRDALRKYTISEAPYVTIRVRDFNFSPLKKLLAEIKKAAGGLRAFQAPGGMHATRLFNMVYTTTSNLPRDAVDLVKVNKVLGRDLWCFNTIVQCDDLAELERFYWMIRELDTSTAFLRSLCEAIEKCIGDKRRALFADLNEDAAIALKNAELDAEMLDPNNLPAGYEEFVAAYGPRWREAAQWMAAANEGRNMQEGGMAWNAGMPEGAGLAGTVNDEVIAYEAMEGVEEDENEENQQEDDVAAIAYPGMAESGGASWGTLRMANGYGV